MATQGSGAGPSTRSGRSLVAPLQEFFRTEAASGVVLAIATVAALVWANSRWSAAYEALWHHEVSIGLGRHVVDESLSHWVNDLAMALFFFVVGLEIKRELVDGELRDPRTAALPIAGAIGGMLAPAAIYLALNGGHPETSGGWGIPMATDIAFSVGVLTLFGRRVPASLKLFLLTLAIVDDLGAILVIGFFYSDSLGLGWLTLAATALVGIVVLKRLGVRNLVPYLVLAAATWLATYHSGVHATIAGVALGLLTPARPIRGAEDGVSPLARLEHVLHPWSAFVVLPLFALANAGVPLDGGLHLTSSLTAGIVAGLVVGKPLGVLLAAVLAVRLGVARLPARAGWPELAGVGMLAGIGFTVSLFVSDLAFEGALADQAKIAVLVASVLAGVGGTATLLARRPHHPN